MSGSDLREEPPQEPELPSTFAGVLNILDKLVPREIMVVEQLTEHELEDPMLEATFRRFKVMPALAERMDLGDTVRCRIMHDGTRGAAIIMRSRNLFNSRKFGFYIQPESDYDDNPDGDFWNRTYRVWQAPVKDFSLRKRYWGMEKLKVEDAWLSSLEVSDALIESLLINSRGGSLS